MLKAAGLNPMSDQNLRTARNYMTEIKAPVDRTHLQNRRDRATTSGVLGVP